MSRRDQLVHRFRRLESSLLVQILSIGQDVGVARKGVCYLHPVVPAEGGHENGVDIVKRELRPVAGDKLIERQRMLGLGELPGPNDIHGGNIVAGRVADEVRRDLGEEFGVAQDVDAKVDPEISLGAGRQLHEGA